MIAFHSTAARSLVVLTVLCAAGVAACSSSSTPTASPATLAQPSIALATPEVSGSAEASATAQPSASDVALASATPAFTPVPTSIDPCTLVTQAEASKLVGFKLAAGTASTLENNDRLCAYGAEGAVLQVLVAVAPDAATAKAGEADFKATLEQGVAKAGIASPKLTEMKDFEPGVDAAMVEGSRTVGGTKVSGIALYALKGAVIVAISDIGVGTPVTSGDDLKAQAHTTLSRLP